MPRVVVFLLSLVEGVALVLVEEVRLLLLRDTLDVPELLVRVEGVRVAEDERLLSLVVVLLERLVEVLRLLELTPESLLLEREEEALELREEELLLREAGATSLFSEDVVGVAVGVVLREVLLLEREGVVPLSLPLRELLLPVRELLVPLSLPPRELLLPVREVLVPLSLPPRELLLPVREVLVPLSLPPREVLLPVREVLLLPRVGVSSVREEILLPRVPLPLRDSLRLGALEVVLRPEIRSVEVTVLLLRSLVIRLPLRPEGLLRTEVAERGAVTRPTRGRLSYS